MEEPSRQDIEEPRPRRSPRTMRAVPGVDRRSRTRRQLGLSAGSTAVQESDNASASTTATTPTSIVDDTDYNRFQKRLEWSLRHWRAYLELNLTEFDSITCDDLRLLERRLREEIPPEVPLRIGFWGSSFEPDALLYFQSFLSNTRRTAYMDVARAKLTYSDIAALIRSARGIRVFKMGILESKRGILTALQAFKGSGRHGDDDDSANGNASPSNQHQLEELTLVPHRYDESHIIQPQCIAEFIEALQPLSKTLKKLSLGERLTMRELSCNDEGLGLLVDAMLSIVGEQQQQSSNNNSSSCLQKLNLHLRGGLTDSSLGSLARLFLGLPRRVTLNISLVACPNLFANTNDQNVEEFMRGLEQRVCSIGSFKTVSVGIRGKSAARLFQAMETFQNNNYSKDGSCPKCNCEVIARGILTDCRVLRQLEKSIPRMQGIDRFTVEDLSRQLSQRTWSNEKTEKLLGALEKNSQLDDLDVIIAGRHRPLRHLAHYDQWGRRIYQRNGHLRKVKRKLQSLHCDGDNFSNGSCLPVSCLPFVLAQVANLPLNFSSDPLYSLVKRHVGSMSQMALGVKRHNKPESRKQSGFATPSRKRLAASPLVPFSLANKSCRSSARWSTPPRKISRDSLPLPRKPRRVHVGVI